MTKEEIGMTDSSKPYVLVFGLSIYDIFGFAKTNYRAYDSNPGKVKVSCGGVCRNIAENMARIGMNTKFISILGEDEKGQAILANASKMGLDMHDSLIIKGASTPTYLAILDEKGEMVSAVVDIEIANCFSKEEVDKRAEVIKAAEYMFFGADNPELIEYIVTTYKGETHFVLDPVSTAKAKGVKHLIPYFHTIKPNRYEAEVLCGFSIDSEEAIREAGAYLIGLGVQNVFISLDAEGIYYNNGKEEGIIRGIPKEVKNVTGAGDAFVAGIGYGYLNDTNIKETVKIAITLANITISHEETIHPGLNFKLVEQVMANCKWEEKRFQ